MPKTTASETKTLIIMDALIATIIKKNLGLEIASTTIAQTFSEVESAITKDQFQLIITDLFVDGINVSDYLEFLNTALPDSSIVVLTEVNVAKFQSEVEKQGIEEYIKLPIALDALKLKLKKYL